LYSLGWQKEDGANILPVSSPFQIMKIRYDNSKGKDKKCSQMLAKLAQVTSVVSCIGLKWSF
jgi:hypothetical protein